MCLAIGLSEAIDLAISGIVLIGKKITVSYFGLSLW